MTTETSRAALSVEYVLIGVQANVTLGDQDVNIAVIPTGDVLAAGDLDAAEWENDDGGYANTARIGPTAYSAGTYDIYVQIEGSPEIPVLFAGRMQVT